MQFHQPFYSLCAFLGIVATVAGGEPGPPPPASVTLQTKSDWELLMTLPVWAAGVSGDVGVAGLDPISVDVPFKSIFKNLDMTAAMTLELRRQRWGIVLDGMYLKMSGSGGTPGPLLTSLDVQVEQVLAEVALTYRLWEGQRGYLDLLAGARYMYLDNEVHFDVDSAGVHQLSENLSNGIVDRAVSAIQGEVSKAAARAQAKLAALNLDERAEALRAELRTRAVEKVLEERTLVDIIRAIRDLTPIEKELIKKKVENSREVLAANAALAQAVIQERVAAAVAAARAKAQKAVARAKARLADAIETAVRDAIPESVSGSKSWVDPFVGFRGRLNLTEKLYFSARGDIGGFGVASDLTWNVFGAIGCQWTRSFSTELGYRCLAIDYADGGFVYDTETSGLFLGLNFRL